MPRLDLQSIHGLSMPRLRQLRAAAVSIKRDRNLSSEN
jgi:hypothetical protein